MRAAGEARGQAAWRTRILSRESAAVAALIVVMAIGSVFF